MMGMMSRLKSVGQRDRPSLGKPSGFHGGMMAVWPLILSCAHGWRRKVKLKRDVLLSQ